MAQVTTTKVAEGPASIVIQVQLVSDGTGELSNVPILLPSQLDPPFSNTMPCFQLCQIWWGLSEFDVTFSWGGLVPKQIWTITQYGAPHIDFRSFGGLQDKFLIPPPDVNGELLISTKGFDTGANGSLVIELRKLRPQ